jgi:uncharacterized protein (TIRG00374 family)
VKLAINIGLSLLMLGVCVWLVWPGATDRVELERAIDALSLAEFWPYLAGYLGLLAVTHFCRAWRWNNLLHPIGVKLAPGPLLAISSVGFLAILALPARLGELVRPALIRKKGKVSASAALGTVAVERIIDGLLISIFVFGAFFAIRGPDAPGWMMPTAYAALGVFAAALTFLICALKWPEGTMRIAMGMTLLPRFAPRIATVIEEKLIAMVGGFRVLTDKKNLIVFCLWSIAYWTANGLSVWVLAQGMHLELSVVGAFAVMGLVAVGITLPNSPGLAGQYEWFTQLGLSLYLGEAVGMGGQGLAFALMLHILQVVWYVAMGAVALATPWVSFAEMWSSRSGTSDNDDAAPASAGAPE